MTPASTRLAFSPYFCNQFNSTLARVIDNFISLTVHQANQCSHMLDCVSKTLVMIFPGGFKKFDSALMKFTIQTGSSSRHPRRLLAEEC